jgi:hypothetical protein
MIGPEFLARLEALGAKYPAHTFDFTLDVGGLVTEFSPATRFFFSLANKGKGRALELAQIYLPRWPDDPDLLTQFNRLKEDEKLEALCLYTIPIHEIRHHADMVLTPFGVGFYLGLAAEYLGFQKFSPFLLQNQDFIQAGALRDLDARLETLGQQAIPQEWSSAWKAFKQQTLKFEACTDFRGMEPVTNGVVRDPGHVMKVLGLEFEKVVIHGVASSFARKGRERWFMRASTILEGRAVIASLQWILWNLEGHPKVGDYLARYVRALYPAEGHHDYRCLLDLAAAWMGHQNIEDAFEKIEPGIISNILFMVDSAAWFALQAAIKVKAGGQLQENLFLRFLYALQEMELAYDRGYGGSPLELLPKIEALPRAKDLGFYPLADGVASTLEFLRTARAQLLNKIWNVEVRGHFDHIFGQLERALSLRLRQGYVTPLAAADRGCPMLYIDQDHRFLLEPHQPGRWVAEWFRFRNESIFTPDSRARKQKHLAGQFGLAEVSIQCSCGVLIAAAVPKWREEHRIPCGRCQKVHELRSQDLRFIAIPEELEE